MMALALGCAPKGDTGGSLTVGEMPSGEWALEDTNATSPTFGETISPTDLRGQVSVWYFGHST
ncbi:MAG: hypothetical protein CL927_12235 [Deltaproteobacteria bacterium]|nr:hypothetical protein [Deltaproteobacteria bacterium]HCH65409.1 hypothetical protein [Deltaproteobacteria bacterium]